VGLVKTDDAARGLKFVYLGPQNMRWPAATLPAYGTFFLLALAGVVVTFLTRPTTGVWVLLELPAVLGGSLLLTRFLFKHIEGDRSVSYQLRTIRAELNAPRPQTSRGTLTTAIPADLFTDHREAR